MKHLARTLNSLSDYWLRATGAFVSLSIASITRLAIPRLTWKNSPRAHGRRRPQCSSWPESYYVPPTKS